MNAGNNEWNIGRFDDEEEEDDEEDLPVVKVADTKTQAEPTTVQVVYGSQKASKISMVDEHVKVGQRSWRVSTVKYWPALNNRLTFSLRLRMRAFVVKMDHPPTKIAKLPLSKRKKKPSGNRNEENVFLVVDSGTGDGTTEVWCFGNNKWAQLGLSGWSDVDDSEVDELIRHPFLSKLKIADITYGKDFFVLLTTNGQVYTWGHNHRQQLGLGDVTTSVVVDFPTLMKFEISQQQSNEPTRIIKIRCGRRHTLALAENNSIWMWGDFKGLRNYSRPTEVVFPICFDDRPGRILKIDAGRRYCAAFDDKGAVYIWGGSFLHVSLAENAPVDDEKKWQGLPIKLDFQGLEGNVNSRAIASQQEPNAVIIDIACGERHMLALNSYGVVFYLDDASNTPVEFPKPFRIFESLSTSVAIGAWQGLSVAVSKGEPNQDSAHYCSIWGQIRSRPVGGLPHTASLKAPIKRPFRTPFEEVPLAMAFYLASGTRSLVQYDRQLYLDRIAGPFQRRMMNLFNNRRAEADIEFVFPGDEKQSIWAHRFYLKIRSEYMAHFLSETWNAQEKVIIEQVDYETFHLFIYYLYTGQLDINWRQAGKMLDLAECALEVPLVELCLDLLLHSMDNLNCLYVYDLIKMHRGEKKATAVLAHIRRHYGEKVAKEALKPKKLTLPAIDKIEKVPSPARGKKAKNTSSAKKEKPEPVKRETRLGRISIKSTPPPVVEILSPPSTSKGVFTRRSVRLAAKLGLNV